MVRWSGDPTTRPLASAPSPVRPPQAQLVQLVPELRILSMVLDRTAGKVLGNVFQHGAVPPKSSYRGIANCHDTTIVEAHVVQSGFAIG
nr:hypothetical protein CFP56_71752 [Quercus suber]